MLLIPLPQAYFKIWKTILLRFIWKGKKQRISLQVLTRDRKQGGLGVPDLKIYHKAVLLMWVIDWIKKKKNKRWVELENTISKTELGK